MANKAYENHPEIELLRKYLRMDTISAVPEGANYKPVVELLEEQAKSIGLEYKKVYPANSKKPVVILSWIGKNPKLPSIMCNSHMDIVTSYRDQWTHEPLGAEMDDEGNIYARGIQDTKALGIMYLAAIRNMKKNNVKMERSIHVTFVPDEEIGGKAGMKAFVETSHFQKLNVGFMLDESAPTPMDDKIGVVNGERRKWAVAFKFTGPPTHGSVLEKGTAPDKFSRFMSKMYDYRAKQMKILDEDPSAFGRTISVNATIIEGGVQINVVPAEITVKFDMRLGPQLDHDAFEEMFAGWVREEDGEYEFIEKEPFIPETELKDDSPYWMAMKSALKEMGYGTFAIVFPATTDSRYVREKGIPAVGFLPVTNVTPLAHGNDEYMPAQKFLDGIEIMKKVIEKLGNAPTV